MSRSLVPLILLALVPATALAAPAADPTATALEACLNAAANASTAGQTQCEADAARSYDRRMNTAYAALMRTLPAQAAQRLRVAQRAWLAFRSAETDARRSLYATRSGTMYVPMAAHTATVLVRDRALQLETYLRVMTIDG